MNEEAPGPDAEPSPRPYFAAADWLWEPIPPDPALHAATTQWAGYLAAGQHVINLDDYANAIIYPAEIHPDTPRYTIPVDRTDWGPNPFRDYQVPIPASARDRVTPFDGSNDAWLIIADLLAGKVYHLWRAHWMGTGWRASWGQVSDLAGDGCDDVTGSGLSNFAGTIRLGALQQAAAAGAGLGHALQFSSDATAGGRSTDCVPPATKTDAHMWSRSPGITHPISQGTRVQLDPAVDVDALPGIGPAEKVIARTLQTHGAYLIDNGGARMAFMAERQPGGSCSAYADLGLQWDYFDLTRIPWGRLRILRHWHGRETL